MNTDDLIASLVADHRPVDPLRLERLLLVAVLAALGLCVVAVWLGLGLRSDLMQAVHEGNIVVKFLFMLSTVAVSAHLFLRLARPGQRLSDHRLAWGLPGGFILAAAAIEWGRRTSMPDASLVLGGSNWLACILLVPVLAIVPFAALVMVLRRAAPTDLAGVGFATGVFSASIAATAYAAHCPCDAPTFVAIWYPIAFAFGGLAGAGLMPRLVRW